MLAALFVYFITHLPQHNDASVNCSRSGLPRGINVDRLIQLTLLPLLKSRLRRDCPYSSEVIERGSLVSLIDIV